MDFEAAVAQLSKKAPHEALAAIAAHKACKAARVAVSAKAPQWFEAWDAAIDRYGTAKDALRRKAPTEYEAYQMAIEGAMAAQASVQSVAPAEFEAYRAAVGNDRPTSLLEAAVRCKASAQFEAYHAALIASLRARQALDRVAWSERLEYAVAGEVARRAEADLQAKAPAEFIAYQRADNAKGAALHVLAEAAGEEFEALVAAARV